MISLKCLKRRNRSSRLKSPSLKRLKRRRPKAEFIIGARCIGIRPIEPGIGARCIGIRAIEGGVKAPRIPIRDIELPCAGPASEVTPLLLFAPPFSGANVHETPFELARVL